MIAYVSTQEVGTGDKMSVQVPNCPKCGSEEVDLGRHPTLSGAWWGCWMCGHRWLRTPNKDGSLTALIHVDGVEIPPEERRWIG